MIAFDFDYYKPRTAEEAARLFKQADAEGKQPLYYGGGTEIISMARMNQLRTGAVIDFKSIPECNVLQTKEGKLTIGAAITLKRLEDEMELFPLLGATVRDVADHSIRCKATIGSHLCGKFYFREGLLPFLLVDSEAVLVGPEGRRTVPISQILNGEPCLGKGELLVQVISSERLFGMPYCTVKKTKMERIDYPIVRIAALRTEQGVRIAFSGVSDIPFRSRELENILNNNSMPLNERIERVVQAWPAPILDDLLASAPYRTFVLKNTLSETMTALERRRV
ncbi:xanthine dehydrogenase family protein subunit M [Paenibacillus sp. OV219]|uniref:FAD binding domain-containing protein n=1 Tax=Paenibacillus sp. OV219 TaxID=1884377 RepID=UPI0008ACAB30|nr:FAD binding domain-containing protein [Paenibacillus sp. OV219]SEO30796.1 CO or xanthine dehydrogenase, FAD-binding subunit [Paenibacillus sp. OV219]